MRNLMLLVALSGSFLLEACNSCGPALSAPSLAWGVLDQTTNVNTQHSNGDTVAIAANDHYTVTLQVQEPEGIKEMDVSGTGTLTCSTREATNGQVFTSPDPFGVTIPTQTTTIPNPGSTSGFVMSQPINYFQVDCGKHQYANMAQAEEFYSTSGTLKIVGTDITYKGTKRTANLTMTF